MSGMMARLQGLLGAYGPVALGVWFVVFGLTWVSFVILIRAGFKVDGVAGEAGTVGAAYLATQLSKPLRILVTLVLTPVVARILGRSPAAQSPNSTPTEETAKGEAQGGSREGP